jgi:hypothetical protein
MMPLFQTSIRAYQPLTAGSNVLVRKIILRDEILKRSGITSEIRENCKNKEIILDVHFFLYNKSTETGRSEKDLDNLLKVVLDTLQDFMDEPHRNQPGLGLTASDRNVAGLRCLKSFVDTEKEEGLDLSIYDSHEVSIKLLEGE